MSDGTFLDDRIQHRAVDADARVVAGDVQPLDTEERWTAGLPEMHDGVAAPSQQASQARQKMCCVTVAEQGGGHRQLQIELLAVLAESGEPAAARVAVE